MIKHLKLSLCLICAAAVLHLTAVSFRAASSPFQTEQARVDYAKDIQPILAASCYSCHGPQRAMGQLRLDNKTLAMKGGISGAAINPGHAQDSRIIHRVLGLHDEARMPMKGDPLTPQQIDLLKRWIDQGANWPDAEGEKKETASTATIQTHWAYLKPVHAQPPAVQNNAWVRNPIDNFILARLEKEGLKPSPEASKETLVRRLFLDLTGLPPTIKDVDSFVADQSPDAYDKLVDRLLASPHYGERWARPWLDMARYADTNGYEKDRRRAMWKYRDWVINALNQDMPFDEFTIEQLAGDMLPDATNDQKIATGFHRNTLLNQEGGIDVEEARWETIIDRVNTTSAVWLGSTLGCAQCHNHKYDPFTQKDYYRMFAFFDNVDYHVEGEGDRWIQEPQLDLPTPEQAGKRNELKAAIARLETTLKTSTPELEAAQVNWEKEMTAFESHWTPLDPATFTSSDGTSFTKNPDKSLLATGINPERDTYIVTASTELQNITGIRLEVLTDPSLPRSGPGRDPYGNFVLTGFTLAAAPVNKTAAGQPVLFQKAQADNSYSGLEPKTIIETSASNKTRGWSIDATKDQTRLNRQAVFTTAKPVGFPGGTLLTFVLNQQAEDFNQGLGRFRLSVTTDPNPLEIVKIPARLRPIIKIPAGERTEEQRKDLAAHYRSVAPLLQNTRDQLSKLREDMKALGIVNTGVMQERASYEWPSTFLRVRGAYLNKGEKVYAAVPAVLPQLSDGLMPNRLGLARWLVSENNPLTARVTVNRYWEQLFGRGIVETSEDFGSQGERPTHQELLDWLATEFIARKWSAKAMIRLLMTSATYRQSSASTPQLLERDPYNKLLARGPRFRLEAEMIRDVALAVSARLSEKVGGPSVFPQQPEGIWDLPYNDDQWKTSEGEDAYRRGLYTFIRRTSPYPSFVTFDAPSREFCTVRRIRTNTPLQSLTTLNDPAFFDNARHLARRILNEGGADLNARLAYGFRLCTARAPKSTELNSLVKLYQKELANYQRDANAARRTAGVAEDASQAAPELAAFTLVSNVLLNLDETLTKE